MGDSVNGRLVTELGGELRIGFGSQILGLSSDTWL